MALVFIMASLITNIHLTKSLSPKAVVIFCHGSGDTGPGARAYVEAVAPPGSLRALADAGISISYPSAAPRPYRLAGGQISSVWFDRRGGMSPRNPEDTESVEPSAASLFGLIEDLIRDGTPSERIALGGFSMGGGIALQTAARMTRRLGAVFALSSYLCEDSQVWEGLERNGCVLGADGKGQESGNTSTLLSTPVFMSHGEEDNFVLPAWGKQTAERLRKGGVDVRSFVQVPGAGHEMIGDELLHLFNFLLSQLSDD